ncbi:MAG: 4Fe-4S binding protein [Dehalococcoidia bacterium]|nr:4Fe-4S binding protein [Dehalococcoidia bacterium]
MSDPYTEFAGKYAYQGSERFRKVLQVLMNRDEVAIANMLPATAEELASKTDKTADDINKMLYGLFRKGVIFESSRGYRPARDIFQLHDATGSDMRSDQIWGRDLLDAWWDFSENELYKDVAKWVKDFATPVSRVIPARAAVAEPGKLLPDEDIEGIIDRTTRVAVVNCPCRRMAQKCDRPIEVCLQLNKGADYTIKRGSGREVSKDEAKKILRTASEGGLVHSMTNTPEMGHFICNCCPDCCIFMMPWLTYGGVEKGIARSRFEARVDVESCSGCQDCVEQCPFGAIEMIKVAGHKKMKATVNPEKCFGCGVCAVQCATDSIKLYQAHAAVNA